MKCFLVDDDADDQDFFKMALKEIDSAIECKTFCRGLEALELLDSGAEMPSYIFLDINMPRMNGVEWLEAIRNRAYLKNVPVIMMSTTIQPDIKEKCQQLGASDYLIKPHSIDQLVNMLATVLNRR